MSGECFKVTDMASGERAEVECARASQGRNSELAIWP